MDAPFDKLLVLDLDETLIHTRVPGEEVYPDRPADFWLDDGYYFVYRRPGVENFLSWCFDNFREVALWTAGTRNYAMEVLPHLCDVNDFSFVWVRERCTYLRDMNSWGYEYLKDLKKLRRKGYDIRKILAVDDTPAKFQRSYGNYIRVWPFEGNCPEDDNELEILQEYLAELGPVPNVRTVEKRFWHRGRTGSN